MNNYDDQQYNFPVQQKIDTLEQNKQNKINGLVDKSWEPAILESYTDADSPTLVGVTGGLGGFDKATGTRNDLTGKLTEDRDDSFDAYEVGHPGDPYRTTLSGIKKYERQRQRLENDIKTQPGLAQKLGVKDVNNITDDDIARAGTREQLLGLYNAIPGEKAAWEPGPLDAYDANNPLELGSKDNPLNIPVERRFTGEYDYFGRPLAEIRNQDTKVSTAQALGYTGQEDAGYSPLKAAEKLHAEGKLTPELADYLAKEADRLTPKLSGDDAYSEAKSGDVGYRLANTAKAVASGVAGAGYDVADFGAELFNKDLGTDEEKTKAVNELTGYNPYYTSKAGQEVKNEITKMTKEGVTADGVFSTLKSGFTNPEFLGESIGWLIPMVAGWEASLGAKGVAAATKGLKAAEKTKDAAKIAEATAELNKAKNAYSGVDKAVDFVSKNAGLFTVSAGETNDTLDKYAENAGIAKEDITAGKVAGTYLVTAFKNGIDKWSDLGILKSPEMRDGIAAVLKGATTKQLTEVGKGLAKVGKAAGVGGVKESGTEYVQTFFEQVGEQVGEQAKKTITDAWNSEANEVDRLTGAALGLTGSSQMNVMSMVNPGNLKGVVTGKSKPKDETFTVDADEVTIDDKKMGPSEEDLMNTRQVFELSKRGDLPADTMDMANSSSDLESYLSKVGEIDTDEYADIVKHRDQAFDKIINDAVIASEVPADATEAEIEASVKAFNDVINNYGLNDNAREALLARLSENKVLGTLPGLGEQEKRELTGLKLNLGNMIKPEPASKVEGLKLDLSKMKPEGSQTSLPVEELKLDTSKLVRTPTETKQAIEIKVESAKANKPGKIELTDTTPTDESLGVGTKTENGSTSGISARTLVKLGQLFGLKPEAVRDALDLAAPMMSIKQMKTVSKEAANKQYDTYYGKDGIRPSYIGYKKAVQDGNAELAYTYIDKLRKKATQLERAIFRHEDAIKDLERRVNNTLDRYTSGSIDAERATIEIKNTTKNVMGNYTISGADIAYGKLPQELQALVGEPSNNSLEVLEAQKEAIANIDQLLAFEGIGRSKPKYQEVKVADRVKEYSDKVEATKAEIAKQEEIVKTTENATQKENEKTYLKYLKEKLAKDEEALANYVTKYPDKDTIYRDVYEEDTDVNAKAKDRIKEDLGREVGTQSKEQGAKAEAEGREAKNVAEVAKVADVSEIPGKVKELKELKESVDKVASEATKARNKAKEKLAENKALARELSETNGKVYSKLKGTLDNLYSQLDKLKEQKKARTKELKKANKAEEDLVKNVTRLQDDVVDTSVNVDEVYSEVRAVEKEINKVPGKAALDYREGVKSLADVGKLAKEVYSKLKQTTKLVGLTVMRVRKILANKKAEEIRSEIEYLTGQIESTELQIKKAIEDAKNGVISQKDAKLVEKVAKGIAQKRKLEEMLYGEKTQGKIDKAKSEKIKKILAKIKEIESELYGDRLVKSALHNSVIDTDVTITQGDIKDVQANIGSMLKTKRTLFGHVEAKDLAELITDEKAKTEYLKIVNEAVDVLSKVVAKPDLITDKNEKIEIANLVKDPASLILWDKTSDGVISMNKQVAAVIALVANEYVGTQGTKLVYNSKEDIARMLDKLHEWQVTKEEYKLLRDEGKFLVNEATTLGSQILGALGIIKDNNSMPRGQYAQLTADLGMYALLYAQSKGDIEPLKKSQISADKWNDVMASEDSTRDKTIDAKASVGMVKGIKDKQEDYLKRRATMKVINEALDIQDTGKDYRTTPIKTEGKKYTIRNGYGDAPTKNQEVLKKLEEQEWRVVEDVIDELADLTDNELQAVMGWKDVVAMGKSKNYLKDDVDAQEAKNREIEDSIASLRGVVDRVAKGAIKNRLYFEWFFAKNGRYMMESTGLNPQVDKKLGRFVVVPKEATEVTWDLNNDKDRLYFMSGILQGLGVELDGHTTKEIVETGEKLLKEIKKNPELIKDLKERLITKREFAEDGKVLSVKDYGIDMVAEHPGHTLQALAALKKYAAAKDGKVKAVVTMEFDAKTSGFALKLLQLPFDTLEAQAKWLEKTAIYITGDKLKEIKGVGSNDALANIEDGYKTLGRAANDGVSKLTDDEEGDIFGLWKHIKSAEGAVEDMIKVDEKTGESKVTSFARKLFKYPFMRFNYAESISSNKKSLARDLAIGTLSKIVDGSLTEENAPDLFKALGKTSSALKEELATKDLETIKVDMVINDKKGVYRKTVPIVTVFQTTFEATYGKVLEDVMQKEFGHIMVANDMMIAATQVMADGFIAELKEVQKKNPKMTEKELREEIKKLEKVFPMIKAPFSKSRSDGISLIGEKRASAGEWSANTRVTPEAAEGQKTLTVQAIIREFERAQAAGAVIPTHWTDGSIISEVLGQGGVLGIHDAIALGLGGKHTEQMVQDMNKATLTVSRDYNILQNVLDAYVESLNNMSEDGIKALKEAKGMTAVTILEDLTELVNKNNQLRATLFKEEIAVANIVGYEGSVYRSIGIKEIDGILSKEELNVLKGRGVDLKAINEMVDKAVKECANGM